MGPRIGRIATLLAATLTLGTAVQAAVPERAPRLSPGTLAVLAGGIDSLGQAHPAATPAAAPAGAAPAVLSRVPVDVPEAALRARLHGTVSLRVRVARTGLVDSVRVVSGDARLREAAATCARWWLFAPPPRPTWTDVAIDVDGRVDADPLLPDVLAMARDAERRGAPWEAIDAYAGALGRVGRHPRLQNPWALRSLAIRDARRAPGRLKVPGALMAAAQHSRGQQFRTMAGVDHMEFVDTFDDALLVCPWWADGYQWRAASLLQCGRGEEAMRTLMLFREAAADSAARSLADRAIASLAAGDTIVAAQMLTREGVQFNRDEDADH